MDGRWKRGGTIAILVVVIYMIATWVQEARREVCRWRAESRMSLSCERIRELGGTREEIVALLGQPFMALTNGDQTVKLFFLVRPTWLPDNDLHIGGCTVAMQSNKVTRCSMSTERSDQVLRGWRRHRHIWFGDLLFHSQGVGLMK